MTDSQIQLLKLALDQGRIFTAKQAVALWMATNHHADFVKSGAWAKESRGIYRLASLPLDPWHDLIVAWFWTQDIKGTPVGIISHASAFALFELSDLMPAVHTISVPIGFRRR